MNEREAGGCFGGLEDRALNYFEPFYLKKKSFVPALSERSNQHDRRVCSTWSFWGHNMGRCQRLQQQGNSQLTDIYWMFWSDLLSLRDILTQHNIDTSALKIYQLSNVIPSQHCKSSVCLFHEKRKDFKYHTSHPKFLHLSLAIKTLY